MIGTNAETMKAAILYGPEDLRIEQIPLPKIADDEVLVRVEVALTCGTDLKVWRNGSHARMIRPPAIFGHEFAGVVVAKGSAVDSGIRVGMRVVAANSAPCGSCYYCQRDQETLCEDLLFNNGAYAEFARIPGRIVRKNLLEIPEHVSFEDAAMTEPLACVLRGVGETRIAPGSTVAVLGCGPIGLKFVRVLAARGFRVIAIAKRASQREMAERLGAHVTLDLAHEANIVERVKDFTDGRRGADAVMEAVGRPQAWEDALQMVRRGGMLNLFGGCARGSVVAFDPTTIHYSEITIRSTFHHTPHYVRESLAAIARGEVKAREFLTQDLPLEDLPQWFSRMRDRQGEMKATVRPGNGH